MVRETDGGIVVSGAKMLATASALTHATFVAQNSASAAMLEKGKAEDYALVFIAPMDTKGQKLISRPSYELRAESPFDHPLSSRFDENDAVVIYDNAFTANGTDGFRGVQAQLGEVIGWRNLVWAMTSAMGVGSTDGSSRVTELQIRQEVFAACQVLAGCTPWRRRGSSSWSPGSTRRARTRTSCGWC